MRRYASVPFSDVQITGPFWSERLETVLTRTIPSQHKQLEKFNMLRSLKLPKPVPPTTIPPHPNGFTTEIFWDSDIGKWVEAASYALTHRRDAVIEAQIEEIVADLEKAQAPDGYLNCWYLEREPQNRWTNLRDNHELYNAGHLLEGAVAYFRATGRDRMLAVMERYMDHIAATFGPDKKRGYCGHQEIELALVKAFHATGKRKFLDLATYFIDERGAQPHYFDQEAEARGEAPGKYGQGTYEYSQSHLPVRQQTKVVGHAVRAMYMYTAMADLAAEHGDDGLKAACERLWRDVTETRMYVTGGFGPSARNEGFTQDYDLPNDTAYAETCASVAMVFWAARMLNLDLDGQYADTLELALYNNALAGLSRDGETYFYDNKLESDGTHQRWEWHPCPCCTMNVARLVASIGGYVFGAAKDEIALHLYGGASATLPVAGGQAQITESSNYPWDGAIRVQVKSDRAFTLSLRIPSWCEGATARVNGQTIPMTTERGYLRIHRQWADDVVELHLPMPPHRVYAHPEVKADIGRVAIKRGPLVYCLEGRDQEAPLHRLRLPSSAALTATFRTDLLGGIATVTATGQATQTPTALYTTTPAAEQPSPLTAVPYYIWANRGPNPMQVWVRE
ncbi:glycoside hydrolase family 127 protein [Stagnihabitans tardus]|uniref:Glycoside hydrolase family 127 protein n=1 Tax=Stagnihabitans tardus TaxID=2699202 RepID=A0AAE5BTI0_9RHOB|nr:beta-L-arabinofuranosidase domain-containing protein [Stagnihabitans tardus]NBZ86736.1 glycoside hydrolase family 127 protein [Stagnihabitans tardus]